jgi:hypothetical protein
MTVIARGLARALEVASRRIGEVCVALARRAAAILREVARTTLRAMRLVWTGTRALAVRAIAACRVPVRALVLALRSLVRAIGGAGRRVWVAFRPLLAAWLRLLASPFRWAARAFRALGSVLAAIGSAIRAGARSVAARVAVLRRAVAAAFGWVGRNVALVFRAALRPLLAVGRAVRGLLAVVVGSARAVVRNVTARAAAGLTRFAGAFRSVSDALVPIARVPFAFAARLSRRLASVGVHAWRGVVGQVAAVARRVGVTSAEVGRAVRASRDSAALAVREALARRRA